MNELIYSANQIESTAKLLISAAGNKNIWLFHGEMGAGKTTLIKELSKQLGSKDDFSSPTFGIIHQYGIENSKRLIYHIDLYRLRSEIELDQLGFSEILDSNDFVFIEWPEIAHHYIPEDHFYIQIEFVDDLTRKVIFL